MSLHPSLVAPKWPANGNEVGAPPPDVDRERRLDEVLAGYLADVRAGKAVDRKQLLSAYPDLADDLAEFFADQDCFRVLATPLRCAAAPLPRSLPQGAFGDYEILSEVARGGMGIVYKARHKNLHRVVALKMLLAGPHASATDRQRFQAEAEAAASLDHPSIVPIYEVGEHDKHPFFAMKFMEGGSLARRLNADTVAEHRTYSFPASPSASSPDRTPEESARLVAPVARAIDHAHRRGVLHRDLKPANILLDDQGQPHVSDFGLARRIDADTRLTQTGALVGTPAYMAPEQTTGKRNAITTAVDIYGLGAILYELVTGRPPFEGEPLDILRQVHDEEPPRPRSRMANIPRDLETIILKCLRKDPARRYASAGALADDLDRFLNGQSITARPTTRLEKVRRWLSRSPLAAGLAAALVVSLLGGFALVVLLWLRAENHARDALAQRDEARLARIEAEWHRGQAEQSARAAQQSADEVRRQRDEADTSFRQAHAAVNHFCLDVSQELASVPSLQPTRKALLLTALRYYQGFLNRRGTDPALERELAETYTSIAQVTSAIGSRSDALTAYRQAFAVYQKLHEANPNDVSLQNSLAGSLTNIGTFQDTRSALETSGRAISLYEQFLVHSSHHRELRSGLALTLGNRGSILTQLGRLAEGEECLIQAIQRQEELVREYPTNEVLQGELAATLGNTGVLVARRPGEQSLALCYFLRADRLREKLARTRPRDARRQADLAASRHSLGIALRDVGQFEAAQEAFQQSRETRQQLAADHPLVTRYQVDLSISLTQLGITHAREGQGEKALELYEQARVLQQKLVEQDPGSPTPRKILAESYFNISVIHGAKKRRVQEGDALKQARSLQEQLVKEEPDNLEFRADLGRTLNNLGVNLWVRKYEDEARAVLRQAITSSRILVERAPEVRSFRHTLNAHHGVLAEIEWRLGHGAVSAEEARQKILLWPGNAQEEAIGAIELARAATVAERAERSGILDESLAHLQEAVKHGYHDLKRLRADPDLELLRPRADFRALLDKLDQDTAHR